MSYSVKIMIRRIEKKNICNLRTCMPNYASRPINRTYANSEDPDQTLQKAASDQGLHYLQKATDWLFSSKQNKIEKSAKSDIPLLTNGISHLKRIKKESIDPLNFTYHFFHV